MSSTGRTKRLSRKKKGWNIKKKEGGVRKSIVGRGLPKDYIQQFGDPYEVTLISRNAWNRFYASPEGVTRAKALAARYQERIADEDAKLLLNYNEQQLADMRKTTAAGVQANNTTNAAAKLAAKTK